VGLIPDQCWHPAIEDDGLRDGAWVAEATGMIGLSSWPEGSRLILRKERPHPGAQLTFTDVDGHRITAFLSDTGRGVIPGQIAGLELRHRQHARVEDRIRQAKASGLRNLPCRGREENSAWLEAMLAAADLICWAKLICFAHVVTVAAGVGVINHYAGGGPISRAFAVIAPGAVVMAMIYAWGPLSGLHINPAVTFGFASRGVFPAGWVVPYWVVQFAGGICAAPCGPVRSRSAPARLWARSRRCGRTRRARRPVLR